MMQLFLLVLEMSLNAGFIILLVLLARVLLKRAPKFFSYFLWGVVLLRLLCPIGIGVELKVPSSVKRVVSQIDFAPETEELFTYHNDMSESNGPMTEAPIEDSVSDDRPDHHVLPDGAVIITAQPDNVETETAEKPKSTSDRTDTDNAIVEKPDHIAAEIIIAACTGIWLGGMLLFVCATVWQSAYLHRCLATACRIRYNVYESEEISTAFVRGVFRTKIYLPMGLSEAAQRVVVIHEKTHHRRGDHVVKLISYLALAIHWFNPLVWLAFRLMNDDMEKSCDESVLRQLVAQGEDIRSAKLSYGYMLLAMSGGHHRIISPVCFAETNAKSRTQNVLKFKKASWKAVVICFVVALAVLFLCMLRPTLSSEAVSEVSGSDVYISEGDAANSSGDMSAQVEMPADLVHYLSLEDLKKLHTLVSGSFSSTTYDYTDFPDTYIVGDPGFDDYDCIVCSGDFLYGLRGGEFYLVYYYGDEAVVVVPESYDGRSVVGIGYAVFNMHDNLREVSLPETIRYIDYLAFNGCDALSAINFPDALESIKSCAFQYCHSLTSVVLSENLVSLEREAFLACDSLVSADLSRCTRLKTIGERAFSSCDALSDVKLPEGLRFIESSAFRSCNATAIQLPDSVEIICPYAFYDCKNLSSVNLPRSAHYVDETAFACCNQLTQLTVPQDMERTGISNGSMEYTTISPSYSITLQDYLQLFDNGQLLFYELDGEVICTLAPSIDPSEVEYIYIPAEVTIVADDSFSGCINLRSVYIASKTLMLGDRAFMDCTSLFSFYTNALSPSIGDYCFANCSQLPDIIQHKGDIAHFGEGAFMNCTNMAVIGLNTPEIGDYCFSGCTNLTAVSINVMVRSLGDHAFENCTNLLIVTTAGNGLEEIGDYCFNGCNTLNCFSLLFFEGMNGNYELYSSLPNLMPDTLRSIGEYAFGDCMQFFVMSVPESAVIDETAFEGCAGFELNTYTEELDDFDNPWGTW